MRVCGSTLWQISDSSVPVQQGTSERSGGQSSKVVLGAETLASLIIQIINLLLMA